MDDGMEALDAFALGIVVDLYTEGICIAVGTCLLVKALLAEFLG